MSTDKRRPAAGPGRAGFAHGSGASRATGPGPAGDVGDGVGDWPARLRAVTEESARRRAARAAARRERTARRAAGLAARQAWRQARLDARAADRDRHPPS